MLDNFCRRGKASFVLGGQFGSEAKGASVAFLATKTDQIFDIVATNNGSQSGHTSIHDGVKRITYHLPTYSLFRPCLTYLDAGSVIDPEILLRELEENPQVMNRDSFAIHPNAALITPECKEAEGREDSAQTRIASTRKGVGEALSRKVLRSGFLAKDLQLRDLPWYQPGVVRKLRQFVRRIDLNAEMQRGKSVLVEVPQGHSLSIDGPFYPYTTSRNCTVMQAMSDAGIHPCYYHRSMLVIRTFPIRVGGIPDQRICDHMNREGYVGFEPLPDLGHSGPCFDDQHEITWEELGQKPEITTVTKRVRRVFTFSEEQVRQAIAQTRPAVIYLTFCDYLPETKGYHGNAVSGYFDYSQKVTAKIVCDRLRSICNEFGSFCNDGPQILTQWGPTTDDVIAAEDL